MKLSDSGTSSVKPGQPRSVEVTEFFTLHQDCIHLMKEIIWFSMRSVENKTVNLNYVVHNELFQWRILLLNWNPVLTLNDLHFQESKSVLNLFTRIRWESSSSIAILHCASYPSWCHPTHRGIVLDSFPLWHPLVNLLIDTWKVLRQKLCSDRPWKAVWTFDQFCYLQQHLVITVLSTC